MNTPIDSSQQTPLIHFADTLSKWCRKAIVPRRNEDEPEEEFSFGIDESMWDKNSMWHLYDDYYRVGECEECEEWDEQAMLDIVVTGEQPKDLESTQEERSTTATTTVPVDDAFGSKEGEWNDAEIIIDSAGFDEASFYSDEDVSYYSSDKLKMAVASQQGAWVDQILEQL